jgi:hypothetical protein
MILNRLGLNNLIEPLIKDLEFQLQDPFLLYKNANCKYEAAVLRDDSICESERRVQLYGI